MDSSGWKAHPTQAVLPLVGLAAENVIRDPYNPRAPPVRPVKALPSPARCQFPTELVSVQ
ncbi:MAG: hypothetical protein ACQESR_25405 [Planctomycetota bacterium]